MIDTERVARIWCAAVGAGGEDGKIDAKFAVRLAEGILDAYQRSFGRASPFPRWFYMIDNWNGLKVVSSETEQQVEFWSKTCKELGRNVDDFCREELKEWKRRSKAVAWVRKWWNGEVGHNDSPAELEEEIYRVCCGAEYFEEKDGE